MPGESACFCQQRERVEGRMYNRTFLAGRFKLRHNSPAMKFSAVEIPVLRFSAEFRDFL